MIVDMYGRLVVSESQSDRIGAVARSKHFLTRAEDPDLVRSDLEGAQFASAAEARSAQCIPLHAQEKAIIQKFWLERTSSLEAFTSIIGSVATVVELMEDVILSHFANLSFEPSWIRKVSGACVSRDSVNVRDYSPSNPQRRHHVYTFTHT